MALTWRHSTAARRLKTPDCYPQKASYWHTVKLPKLELSVVGPMLLSDLHPYCLFRSPAG